MSDIDYKSTSLPSYIKEELNARKGEEETYADVIRRALTALREKNERQESQREWDEARRREQTRMLVRIADAVGVDAEYIPQQAIAEESKGDTIDQADDPLTGMFTLREESNEATLDLNREQRQTAAELRSKAHNHVIEQRKERGEYERPGDNPPRDMVGADQERRAMLDVIEENPDRWHAAAEELADAGEIEEGWMDSFDSDDGGDH